jgi:hypothetical protein
MSKNIYLIPTDKPSKLHITSSLNLYPNGVLCKSQGLCKNQHIYITSSEVIKQGDWCIDKHNVVYKQETNRYSKTFQLLKCGLTMTYQKLHL